MTLIQKYVKYINGASTIETELIILLPLAVFAYLFFPNVEYAPALIVSGFLSTVLSLFHLLLGAAALMNKNILGAFNLLILPVAVFVILVLYGHNLLRF